MTKISAGSYDLNKWLRGGYEDDIITTLYGGPGTGKTNLAVLAAVSAAKKGNKVIFIDTEGGFSTERTKQILGMQNGNTPQKRAENKQALEKTLQNILLLKPTNFSEQKKAFAQLLKHTKEQVSLIIVDGMTMLYRLEFANARQNNEGNGVEKVQTVNSDLTKQMRLLAEISRKNNIPIIITNQVYHWEGEQRMVGGDILKYWSKCLIELENTTGRRTIKLRKHRSLPEKSMTFQIYDGGIRKKGWI